MVCTVSLYVLFSQVADTDKAADYLGVKFSMHMKEFWA